MDSEPPNRNIRNVRGDRTLGEVSEVSEESDVPDDRSTTSGDYARTNPHTSSIDDATRWPALTALRFRIHGRRGRDERLYRDRYATFEAYCRERWGFTRQRAFQLTEAAQVSGLLSTIVDTDTPAIRNEAQARELVPLRDDPEAIADNGSQAALNWHRQRLVRIRAPRLRARGIARVTAESRLSERRRRTPARKLR
jgi:hypothetical protein